MGKEWNEYNLESLGSAVYAITSWPGNRRYVGIVDEINKLFLKTANNDLNGDKKISSYQDFMSFFHDVERLLDVNQPPELFPVDEGEVKFRSIIDNNIYKIFIGNGSDDTYENCYLIDMLVSKTGKFKQQWLDILAYEDMQISTLYPSKVKVTEKFSCPTEDFFIHVINNYQGLSDNSIKEIFSDFVSENSELYPFFSKQQGFPVFLPVMKESFFEQIESQVSSAEISNSAWEAIRLRLFRNYGGNVKFNHSILASPKVEANGKSSTISNGLILLGANSGVFLYDETLDEHDRMLFLGLIHDNKTSAVSGYVNEIQAAKVQITNQFVLTEQPVDTNVLTPNISKIFSDDGDAALAFDANSVVGIINGASSTTEIIDFIEDVQQKKEKIISSAGFSGIFSTWKNNDHVLNEGAGDAVIFVLPYTQVQQNFNFFDDLQSIFPFGAGVIYDEWHHWKIEEKSIGYLKLLGKNQTGMLLVFTFECKFLLYYETQFIMDGEDTSVVDKLTSFSEIVENELIENSDQILSEMGNEFNEINVVSHHVLEQNAIHRQIINTKYSSNLFVTENARNQVILMSPKWDEFQRDNLLLKTRSFENDVLDSIISGLIFKSPEQVSSKIHLSDGQKRTSGASEIAVPYYIDQSVKFYAPRMSSFKAARHMIAEIVADSKIDPGVYKGTLSLQIVKKFRKKLRETFIQQLKQFDGQDVNRALLNLYSADLFETYIHQKRIETFNNQPKIETKKREEFFKKTVELREETRQYKPVLEYILEENLLMIDRSGVVAFDRNNIDDIVAFAKWIIDFQMQSDEVQYGDNSLFKLEILDDYRIQFIETEREIRINREIESAKYRFGDYSLREDDIDQLYLKQFEQAFYEDTGMNYRNIMHVLGFLSSNQTVTNIKNYSETDISKNVVETDLSVLANKFVNELKFDIEIFYQALKFLSISIPDLANDSGLIPIWEKKKRQNKITAQPIWITGKKMVYSPVMLNETINEWTNGLASFSLPYQVGMARSTELLNNWKKQYERKIVIDLAGLFDKRRYDVEYNEQIYKYDKDGNYSRNLGDYDLIVVDKYSHIVLLIEVKYMRLNQTVKESVSDQREYFVGKKSKATKFLRRIQYFEKYLDDIMKHKGYHGKYKIQSYFIANKITRSFYLDFPFHVLGFNEFKQKLKDWDNVIDE